MKWHASVIGLQQCILLLFLLAGCELSFAQDPSSAASTASLTSSTTISGQTRDPSATPPATKTISIDRSLKIPPLITLEPQKDLVFWNIESIQLPCIATGTPKPSYRWQKNGTDFDPDDEDGWISIQRGVGTLIFARPQARDEAIYQCFAYNVAGTALTVKVNLRQAMLQPFQTKAIKYNYPSMGSSLQLRCIPPTSFPKASVFWATIAEGTRFIPIDMSDRVTQDLEGNLNFVNIMEEDFKNNNTYTCIAQNRAMRSIQLGEYNKIIPRGVAVVYYKPAIMWQSPTQQVVVRGATIAFKCIFSGCPTPTVNWTRSDKPMSGKVRFESFGQQLTIDDVQYDDAGRYECQGINDQTMVPIRRSFDLSVESAPFWVTKPESVNATVNDTATFTCVGEGIPNPNYFWFLNGVPITEVAADPRRIVTENTMTFVNLTTKDVVVIQCNVTNKYGYNFTNAYLNVLDDLNDATTRSGTTDPKMYSSLSTSVIHDSGTTDPKMYSSVNNSGTTDPKMYSSVNNSGTTDPKIYSSVNNSGTTDPKIYASLSTGVIHDSGTTDHRIKDSASVVFLGEDAKILVILFVMFRIYETMAILLL